MKKNDRYANPQYDDNKMPRHMGDGNEPGDMSAHTDVYQLPGKDFSQEGFSKTTEYIQRQDKHQSMNARDIRKQGYEGRYS